MGKKKLNNSGSSLVEVLVAIMIMGAFLVAFQSVFIALTINRAIRHQETAARVARTKIESLRVLPFGALPPGGPFADPLLAKLPGGQANLVIADVGVNIKQVVVVITWSEGERAVTRTVEFVTLIASGGL